MVHVKSNGNGGASVEVPGWKPNTVRRGCTIGIVGAGLLTLSGWVFALGQKTDQLDRVISDAELNRGKICAVKDRLTEVEKCQVDIANDVRWLRRYFDKNEAD